jgi:hypothetical protein
MLRFIIWGVVIAALIVLFRLVRLSFKFQTEKKVIRQDEAGNVIEMPSRDPAPMVLQEFSFANFDETAAPRDLEDFFERVFVKIGRAGESHGQTYSLHVTTPKGLQRAVASETFRFGRDILVVERFDRTLIRAALDKHLYELPQLARQID